MTHSLRIALYHNLPSGGAKRAVYEWTRRLAAWHKIDVFTMSSADHAFCDIRPFVQEFQVFSFSPHRLFNSPWGRLNQLQRWRDLGELARVGLRIAHEIDARGYDVVFAHPCIYTVLPTLLNFVQTPSVYYLHEPFGIQFNREFSRHYLKNAGWRKWANRFDPLIALYNHRVVTTRIKGIKNTARLLANSEFTRQYIWQEFGAEAPLCHYGVDSDAFRPLLDIPKENCVISVGELTPRKGFDFLIESIALLPVSKRPALKLVCNYQDPSERNFILQLAANRNVRLQVIANLSTDQLAVEYNKAQICVYAPVMEPLGLVPLEAMACGTPVVAVSEGGVPETVRHGETGLLTEREPEQFAGAIMSLLDDSVRRVQYGEQGRAYVEKEWRWDNSTRNLQTHLLDVAKKKSGLVN